MVYNSFDHVQDWVMLCYAIRPLKFGGVWIWTNLFRYLDSRDASWESYGRAVINTALLRWPGPGKASGGAHRYVCYTVAWVQQQEVLGDALPSWERGGGSAAVAVTCKHVMIALQTRYDRVTRYKRVIITLETPCKHFMNTL